MNGNKTQLKRTDVYSCPSALQYNLKAAQRAWYRCHLDILLFCSSSEWKRTRYTLLVRGKPPAVSSSSWTWLAFVLFFSVKSWNILNLYLSWWWGCKLPSSAITQDIPCDSLYNRLALKSTLVGASQPTGFFFRFFFSVRARSVSQRFYNHQSHMPMISICFVNGRHKSSK